MCLYTQVRILITTLVLASYSPFGLDAGHPGQLALSLFVGRRTRVAAAEQFSAIRELPNTGSIVLAGAALSLVCPH